MMTGSPIFSFRTVQLVAAVVCLSASHVLSVESYVVGGTNGVAWSGIGELNGLSTATGALQPAGVNPVRDALGDLSRLGGSITSPQASRENLTLLLTDNNVETLWRVTRERRPDGTSMMIDLGAALPINRMSFQGTSDSFLRAFELFVHDGNPSDLRNDSPVAFINQVASNLEQVWTTGMA